MVSGCPSRLWICQALQDCPEAVGADDQQKIDREFVDWLGESNVPFCIVFTKADKLGPVKARMNAEKWMHALEDRWEELPPYFITSSEKKMGRDEVLDYIDEINKSLAGE